MEILALAVAMILLLVVMNWYSNATAPDDDREGYVRDDDGNALALYVRGPVDDVPNHERFIHDGTAHQNPAVNTYTGLVWFLLLPFPMNFEERYYPFTDNGGGINLGAIQRRIDNARLGRHQRVEIVGMPHWAEKSAIRREHGQQLARGVPSGKLRKRGF